MNTLSGMNYERNQLLEWIPDLMEEKINTLSTNQLRILHYILGYNASETSTGSLLEEFEGYGYSQNSTLTINEFLNILERDNYMFLAKPY